MALAGAIFALLLGVVLSGMVARATRVPVPLVQIALGAVIFYSNLAPVDLDPEVFFLVLLPPLLFLDAIERELRLAGLRAEREELLASASAHGVKDIVLRKLVREVDLQEARYSSG